MPWIFNWFPPGTDPNNPANAFPLATQIQRKVRLGSLLGATGPAWTPVTQDVPFQPGSQMKFIKVPDAEIDMRVIFTALTEESLWQRLAAAEPLFNPLNGMGWLQIENPNGNIRRIQCTCISGLNMDSSTYKTTSVDVALTFFANYPYWQNAAAPYNETFFPYNSGQNTIFSPIPIAIFRANDTVYDFNIANAGDVNSFLTVIINGPMNSPILTNLSFGPNPITIEQRGVLNVSANGGATASVGQRFTIDFLNKTIIKGIANPLNQIGYVTPDSNFWPLLPGTNTIRLQLLNATNQTKVQYEWNDAYSTMY